MVKKLFVSNIPWNTSEEQLTEYFQTVGEVKSAKIILDKETKRSRGFGFIEMENADEAMSQLSDKDFQGRPLRVKEAENRKK